MTHPPLAQLQGLLADELAPDQGERVAAHVNDCDVCLERLDALQRSPAPDVRWLAELLVHRPDVVSSNGCAEPAPAPADTPPGWPAFPGYEVLAQVGRGGMGEVYQVRHRRTNRVVALKTLPPVPDPLAPEHAERLARFRTEAEAVSRLQHPNVVSIYDVGEHDGRPYFTMEWVGGGSLAERLVGAPQPERPAARLVETLARAVHYAHQHGVVHRDLKPANILLVSGGVLSGEWSKQDPLHHSPLTTHHSPTPKITDFGVAKLLDRVGGPTRPLQQLGTPEYMAPEQTGEGPGLAAVGPAVDVYALGVLLYELLTGRPPFRADEPLETLRQVREDEPIRPRRLRPRLNRDLETVCLHCLHKDPRRRYASALALAEDLECWRTGRAIRARPSGPAERVMRWARRHPERAGLVALTAAVLLALVTGLFAQGWAGQTGYTQQLAASADHQLLLVKYAVGQTAQDAALRDLLATRNRSGLRTFLVATRREFGRWFTRPGEDPPIINWFVMDPGGTILADSDDDPRSVGKDYAFRDYYAGLTAAGAPPVRTAVYVSRVYRSEQDDRYKFTVITRVWEGDVLRGLVGASVAVDVRLAALDMAAEWPGARVVGPLDQNSRPGTASPDEGTLPYVVVLDRDYGVPGQEPRAAAAATRETLAAFARDPGLRQAADPLTRDGCLVTYARVGDSHFVAVVERLYPWPVSALVRHPLAAGAVLAALAAGAVLLRAGRMGHRLLGSSRSLFGDFSAIRESRRDG
jgi:serine/threonine-protein kinase